MIRLQSLIIFLLIVISSGIIRCSKETGKETNPVSKIDIDTLTFQHSMKGWELYSWPNGNEWNYSVLIGTNRTKSYEEVTTNKIIVFGIDSLKLILNKFPENENIFWIGEGWLERCWTGNHGDLTLPGTETINEIKAYCIQKKLILNITD